MRIDAFVAEMTDEMFPSMVGPWTTFDSFDPPFSYSELKKMERSGIIEMDRVNEKFRLTLKALSFKNQKEAGK